MTDDRDIPPEAGHRAHVRPSGEVRGSGSGAGGGNPGEEYDTDEQGTDQVLPTGVDARSRGTPAQGAGDDDRDRRGVMGTEVETQGTPASGRRHVDGD